MASLIVSRSHTRRRSLAARLALGLACLALFACAPAAPTAERAAPATQSAPSAASTGAPAPSAPSAPTALKLHLPSRSTSYLPWYIAIEQGYFKEQGLDVEIVQATGTVGIQALLAGEMQFSGAASSAVPAIARGAPLKVVYAQSGRANYWLVAKPEIKTLADLKGKRIVVPNLGGSTYQRLADGALRRAGLDPATDVNYVAGGSAGGGSSDVLVGSLVSGLADAMVGNVLQRLVAEEQGFHTIYSFGDEALDLQGGVATTDSLLANQPDLAQRFFVAAVKGTRVMVDDPATSLDVLLKYVELDRDAAARGLEWVRPLTAKDGLIPAAEQPEILAVLRQTYEIDENLEPGQVFAFRPLQQAAQTVDASGWKPK